ncbi:hypothetical protein KCW65_23730, partial [Mycobacterium tuberculosis]|nr:hypothetical protein [Mycobacterium tuberculosis]
DNVRRTPRVLDVRAPSASRRTGISGTKHFLHLFGHGGRPSPGPGWDYALIAEALAEALTATSATRALGVSMSAGGLLRLLSDGHPVIEGLEKVALVL